MLEQFKDLRLTHRAFDLQTSDREYVSLFANQSGDLTTISGLKTVRPALADACDALTAAGDEAEHVDELDVRRAVLADDATVRV